METLMLRPFLIAFYAGLMAMTPLNVFKICAGGTGMLKVDPWRIRAVVETTQRVTAYLRAWFGAFCSRRMVLASGAVLLALLVAHLSASHDGVLLATAIPVVTLKANRATLLREAESLRQADGTFADDAARTAFDAKMGEIDALDVQIRAAETAAPPAPAPAAAGVAQERERITSIQALVRKFGLEDSVAADMVQRGITLDTARGEVLDKLAARDDRQPHRPSGAGIQFGEDAQDKWRRGATAWLLIRSGMAAIVAKHENITEDKINPGEFRGLSLLDLARESLTRAGVTVRGLSKMELAGLAMTHRSNYQSISDFANLLENTMHKVLRAAYGITPDTWSRFCGVGTVSDFRAHNWYRLGSLSQLDDLNEDGEFKNKAIPDAEKASYTATTKGNIISVSRQVIVNDDLGAVMRLTEMLGRAGKLTIEKAVYAKLALNSGLGPTQSDSQPLFHSNRSNVGTGAALSAAAIDADRVVMAQQLEPNGQDYADLRPAILLLPVGLGGQARVINQSQYDPDTVANKAQMKPNVVAGLFRDVVDTPRLSGTRRYLFADPAIAPVFLVSFLEGQREPVLETQDGWRVDGVEMRARLDFGVDVVDWRGAVTNAGV